MSRPLGRYARPPRRGLRPPPSFPPTRESRPPHSGAQRLQFPLSLSGERTLAKPAGEGAADGVPQRAPSPYSPRPTSFPRKREPTGDRHSRVGGNPAPHWTGRKPRLPRPPRPASLPRSGNLPPPSTPVLKRRSFGAQKRSPSAQTALIQRSFSAHRPRRLNSAACPPSQTPPGGPSERRISPSVANPFPPSPSRSSYYDTSQLRSATRPAILTPSLASDGGRAMERMSANERF